MIKKCGAIVLALLYIVTVSGFALNLHYCFNQVSSVSIDSPAAGCVKAPAGNMKCCQDKHFEVKVKDAHQAQLPAVSAKAFCLNLPLPGYVDGYRSYLQLSGTCDHFNDLPDPPLQPVPDFIRDCQLRI